MIVKNKRNLNIEFGTMDSSFDAYRRDCSQLTCAERLACIQQLREAFWGDEASTGRLQRLPEFIKRKAS